MGHKRGTPLERLMRHTEKTASCWLWNAGSLANGYGRLRVDDRMFLAHRLSYELHHGPIPTGLYVCHRCDVRLCVNPDHLFLGTAAENTHDAVTKDRRAVGQRNGNARLTDEQARQVTLLRADGVPRRQVALQFGISEQQVRRISRGYSRKECRP